MNHRVLFSLGLSILATVATIVVGRAQTPRVPAQSGPTEDPLVLFAKMMPVFKHPRCANCHGGTSPVLFIRHPRDFSPSMSCESCHSAASDWHMAPRSMDFFGKDIRGICGVMAGFNRPGTTELLTHIQNDTFINFAFIGTRADATLRADPPPMKKLEFLEAARIWITEGGASCSNWQGTISEEETISANYGFNFAGDPSMPSRMNQTATRKVTITLEDGQITAEVKPWSGQRTVELTKHTDRPPCILTTTQDASLTGGGTGVASARIRVDATGHYTIRVGIPGEKSRKMETDHSKNDCGLPPLPDPPPATMESDWSGWSFTIECPVEDRLQPAAACMLPTPNDPQHFVGQTVRSVKAGESRPAKAWFIDRGFVEVVRADGGEPIPIEVTTRWDLKRIAP